MFGYVAKDKRDNYYSDNGKTGTGIGIKKRYVVNNEIMDYKDILKIKDTMEKKVTIYIIHKRGSDLREVFYTEKSMKKISFDEINNLIPLNIAHIPHIKRIALVDVEEDKKEIYIEETRYSFKREFMVFMLGSAPTIIAFLMMLIQTKPWLYVEFGLGIIATVLTVFGITHGSDELLYLIGDSENQRYVKIKYMFMILVLPISIIGLALMDWNRGYNDRIFSLLVTYVVYSSIIYFCMWKKYRRLFK